MIKVSFWLKTAAYSFLFAVFVFGIFDFGNDGKIKDTVIKNIDAAETSCKGPADVILVVDRSATMSEYGKFNIAKTSSINFIDKLFATSPDSIYFPNDYHQIGLIAFHNLIDNEALNKNSDYLKGIINQSDGIFGDDYPLGYRQTSLAIKTAEDSLDPDLSNVNPSATKTMIVLTDGAPYYNIEDARAYADSAKSDGIRIISVGLKLDSILDETERTKAEEFIKYIASAPFDCYYASDSGDVLDGCNSVSADNLTDALNSVYTSITDAVCDESPPSVSISRKPSGTLYNVDNLIITSTATDDIGFNSHSIRWSDNWSNPEDIQVIECGDLAGTVIECNTGNLGPFSSGTNVSYRSSVTDANENEATIEEPNPRNVIVANVTLTVPALLRNKDNIIKAVISNYGGNDEIFISIDALVLGGIEIDKVPMNCSTSGGTKTCTYTFNPGCDWTNGITGGFANNIDINIYFYAQSGDVGIRQIASSENNLLTSSFEGSSWTGTCTDTINNDCDYENNDPLQPIVDADEISCDTEIPLIGISRSPSGDVYDDDSITFTSNATDSNGIKQHTIYYRENSGTWQTIPDSDSASISGTVGPLSPGVVIEYYSWAMDYSGNDNENSTAMESFIVKNRACEFAGNLGDCNPPYSGKCCDGVCNSEISNPNFYNTDHCAQEICSGISWEWGSANDTVICSESGEPTECHSFSSLYGLPPGDPPYFYDGGCEERAYRCSSGYCDYGSAIIKGDYCIGGGSLILNDYECSGTFCALNPDPAVENDICDLELDSLSVNTYNSDDPIVLLSGSSGVTDGEVLDNLTNKVSLRSSTDDVNGISEQKIYWKKNTDSSFSVKDCDVSSCGVTANPCNCAEDIGPFNIGDIVEFYASSKDDSPNQVEDITNTYSFTVRDHECYYINSQSDKGNIANLTPCGSGGMCCGGTCNSSVSSTPYDEGCYVDSCSETNWVSVAGNEGDDCPPDATETCFDYYTGCVSGNKCASGYCNPDPTGIQVDFCSSNLFTDYECSGLPESCGTVSVGTDCSFDNNSDGDSVACNCDCDNYDIEEKVYSSLSFDGVDDYVKFSDSVELLRSGSTLTFWAKTNTSGSMAIFAKNSSEYYSMIGFRESSFRLEPDLNMNDCSWTITRDTDWHFYALVFENNKAFLWQDGNYIGETGTYTNYGELQNNLTLYNIGMKSRYVGYFNGSIDEVRIYNRALYPEEVLDHYNGIFIDDTGLAGHWDFDPINTEKEDGIVGDRSENGNDGTLSNVDGKLYYMDDSDWVNGKYGGGLDFDGSDDYMSLSGNSLRLTNNTTLSLWMKLDTAIGSGAHIYYPGIFSASSGGSWDNFITFRSSSGESRITYEDASGATRYSSLFSYNTGDWIHVAISMDGSRAPTFYINGNLKGSGADSNYVSLNYLGRGYAGATNDGAFNGLIDEVRIYNRALSDTEVADHYEGIFSDNSGLVGYWDFNEGTGTIAHDSSENGPQWMKHYHGSVTGAGGNVPENWQVCTDEKDNDCDGVVDDYDSDITGISNCDGEVDLVEFTATAMDRSCVIDPDCVEGSSLFSAGNFVTVDDIDIERAENDFTIETIATDEFLIYKTMIEWTTDNWANKTSKVCEDTGICKVCVEGGSCGEDNDDILSLSAGNTFSFRICAWDNSVNRNNRCTDYYNIIIENSNSVPEVTSLSIRDHDFCTDGLEYILDWEFSDPDGDSQASYEIQIKEGNNDFSSGLVVDVKKNIATSNYQILSNDFEDGEEMEYGEDKIYYWRLKVTDSRGGGYERTSEWVEYNDLSDSDGDGDSRTFTTPMYKYPQVDFSAISDSGSNCLYETGYEHVGTETRCNFGENITFSDDSFFVNCDDSDDKQCIISSASKCDVSAGLCVPCYDDFPCVKFGAGYKCEEGVCNSPSGFVCDSELPNSDDCKTADAARCDEGVCVLCDDDSQCSNEKFGTTGVDYFCNSLGECDDKSRREWYFYGTDTGNPDSIDPNPINNYIESESKTYNVIFKVKDIVGNSCYKIKNVLLGGRDYPKWNESSVYNN